MSQRDFLETDYYAALGVTKDATPPEIKKAYRKLARELHPDKNGGDPKAEERFKEVSAAYDVLSDETRRREYDEARALFAGGGRRSGNGRFTFNGPGNSATFNIGDLFGDSGLGDVLGGMFTGGGARGRAGRQPLRGADIESEVTLDFVDAINGVTIPLRLSNPSTCRTCGGSGARPGTAPRVCPACGGSGAVSRDAGGFGFSSPCRDCRGSGRIIDSPCPDCQGSGDTMSERTLTVRIPPGVDDGQRIRLAGKGAPGERGGPHGDLILTAHVAPHPVFGRKGNSLTLALPITYPEAALGAEVRVPTLDGSVTLRIPPGASSGRTFRVRGRGVPRRNGDPGDLLVTVEVVTPSKVSAKARKALETIAAELEGESPRAHLDALLQPAPAAGE